MKLNQAGKGAEAPQNIFSENTGATSCVALEGSGTGRTDDNAASIQSLALTEVMSRVNGFLPSSKDTLALAGVNREGRLSLNVERQAALVEVVKMKVRTGEDFADMLPRVLALPEDERDRPLAALGGTIPRLPDAESQAAFDAWRPHAEQRLANSDPLAELLEAQAEGSLSLAPDVAAGRGANIQAVGQRYHLDPQAIANLEFVATCSADNPNQAGAAAARGEHLESVAARFGITTDKALKQLEKLSIGSEHENSPGHAVQEGENVLTVAQEYGIASPEGIVLLEQRAIGHKGGAPTAISRALDEGGSISAVARKFDITTPESIGLLAMRTIESRAPWSAGSAAERGESVRDIAKRYGITGEEYVGELELRAIGGDDDDEPLAPAGQAVSSGGHVLTVAVRYGITTMYGMDRLQHLAVHSNEPGAARTAIRNGEPWEDAADRLGITGFSQRWVLRQYESDQDWLQIEA